MLNDVVVLIVVCTAAYKLWEVKYQCQQDSLQHVHLTSDLLLQKPKRAAILIRNWEADFSSPCGVTISNPRNCERNRNGEKEPWRPHLNFVAPGGGSYTPGIYKVISWPFHVAQRYALRWTMSMLTRVCRPVACDSRKFILLSAFCNCYYKNNIQRAMCSASSIPDRQAVIYYEKNGGPEVLQYSTSFAVPSDLSATDILIKNKYTGINFIEVYFRNGIYPAEFPYIPGREASGEVLAVGDKVKNFKVGDKVAYLGNKNFAQFTKFDTNQSTILNLGPNATTEQLKLYAASLLQGLTALTFINEAYAVKENDYILVTAAAGGVGLILDQLIGKVRKAHVIAVASTDEKLAKAKQNGAEFLLNSSELSNDQLAEKILEITNGKGVEAIFDSIGKDTFDLDLKVVKRKGTFISYGNSSGAVPPFVINKLAPKNIKLLRPQLFGYVAERSEFEHYTKELFDLINSKKLSIDIYQVYQLKDYPTATRDLEGRKTTGKLLLEIPN